MHMKLALQRKVSPEEISIEFPKMIHGWVTRGDDPNEEVAHDSEKALQLAVKLLQHEGLQGLEFCLAYHHFLQQ